MKRTVFPAVLLLLLVLTACNVKTALRTASAGLQAESSAAQSFVPSPPPAPAVSAEQAKAAALSHAGLTAEQVTGLRAEYERDDGLQFYEVQFFANGMEYEYDISAADGTVISFEKER